MNVNALMIKKWAVAAADDAKRLSNLSGVNSEVIRELKEVAAALEDIAENVELYPTGNE